VKVIAVSLLISILASSCSSPPSRRTVGSAEQRGIPGGGRPGGTATDDDSSDLTITFNTALPRLTHEEWENTVRDAFLLADRPGLAAKFSQDDNSTIFHNDSATNKVTTNLWKDYQEASEELGKRVAGDLNQVKKLVPADAPEGETIERAKAILQPLLLRAYRRPATEAEINGLSNIFQKGKMLTGNNNYDAAGLEAATAAIVQSPQFIYHPEYGTKDGKLAKLGPYEIATRLSYAIWKSIPDKELLSAAAAKNLASGEGIKAQVRRMFKDPRAVHTVQYFLNELFETKKFVGLTKNKELYPKFPNDLGDTLKREAEMFIDDVVVKHGGGITKLLTSTYTFVNDKTAPLYGVALPGTMELTKVELNPKERSGLITQVGWLAANATSERTSSIHRGFYVMSRLACDTLPPMVGSDSRPAIEFKTRRDELTHKTGTCGGECHNNYINPPAFALEAFDASGVFRDKENGNPIDASGVYGKKSDQDPQTSFKNAVELMQGISKRKTTHECFVRRAIELLYNRRTNGLDKDIITRLGKESLDGMGTQDLMIELLSDMTVLSQRIDAE
jgi:hypothetical protein